MGRLYPLLMVVNTLNELTMVSDHERHKRLLAAIQEIESCGLSVYRGRKKDKHFMKIYSEPLYNLLPKLSPSATKVWLALGNEVDYEDTVVEMTIAEIMERTNLSDKPVKTAIRQLEELGVLTRIGPNNRRKYVLSEMYVKRGK